MMRPLVVVSDAAALGAGAAFDPLANAQGRDIQRLLTPGYLSVDVVCVAAGTVTIAVTINTQRVATFVARDVGVAGLDIRRAVLKNVYIGPQDVRGNLDVAITNTGGAAAAVRAQVQITPSAVQ